MDKITEAPRPMDNTGPNGGHDRSRAHSKRTADIFAKCHELTEPAHVKAQGLYPYFRTIEATYGNQVICGGRRKIMIGSNNYLGLAQDERVIHAAQLAARNYGSGCTGSRILNGNIRLHEQLEDELASFLQREAVLVFSTGFFANIGALQTLLAEGDFILCDRENHASIIDGCRMSKARTVRFAHNSAEALRRRLQHLPADSGKLVIVDGVFSMSGDIADLPALAEVAREYGARLYVDEAHGLGVLGKKGEGTAHHFGMNGEIDLVMGTFSKSLGSMGGFIAGPKYVVDYLKHKARCFLFTASLAPAVTAGVLKALQILREEPERIDRLWKNVRKIHDGFRTMGLIAGASTPIVPILIGSEAKAFLFSQKLYEADIFTTPAIYPAVRYGRAIVRTSYMSTHTDDELNYVLETCERVAKELAILDDLPCIAATKRGLSGYDFSLFGQEESEAIRGTSGENPQGQPSLRTTVSGKRL